MNRLVPALILAAAFTAEAQMSDQVRRAVVSGLPGSSGKCTIGVRVDMTAEIELSGDSGRLRTLAGQPASWTRLDCTSALPYAMSDFRLRVGDGRGSVRLVQDPRNNNAMAVIRIDDSKAGAAGYTFDLEWSGASGVAPSVAYPSPAAGLQTGFMSAERAMDLCRAEVHARGERDYGLRGMDINSVDAGGQGRRDSVTGTFIDRSTGIRRVNRFRFICAIDYRSGQVSAVQILNADGTAVQPGAASATYGSSPAYAPVASYDEPQVLRTCQDAVLARVRQEGYNNVSFSSTAVDANRREWISGTVTGRRGPIADTFEFGCSMDFRAVRVRNVELNRK